MIDSEKAIFNAVVEKFKEQYPHRNIKSYTAIFGEEYINIDGEDKFCTTGYNLLYNLQRLVKVLEDELI